MHHFLALVRRFGHDERGVFAVVFGLMAIVLVALGGAVVDYVALEQARNRSQIALDAAALALQPEIFKTTTKEVIRKRAEELLVDRIGDPNVTAKIAIADVVIDVNQGSLYLAAKMEMPTIFVSLVGVPKMAARIQSQATRRMLNVEVVMVLDNSGSMGGSPISNLKTAACNATNILFYDKDGLGCKLPSSGTVNPNITMGIVPFTSLVNIGTQFANSTWLDWTGRSSLAAKNFDNDDDQTTPFTGPVNRRDLFDTTNTTWSGCVEARISPFDTTDDPPNSDERLFLPLFSPDTRDNWTNSYITNDLTAGTCKPKTCTVETRCTVDAGKTACKSTATTTYFKTVGGVKTAVAMSCTGGATRTSGPTTTYPTTTSKLITEVWNIPLTDRERQERLCKYNGSASNSGTNYNCPATAVLPLTDTPGSILTRINNMVASGNTNIQQGTVWGMHALTDSEPLTQALPQETGRVAKIMIIMTDGDNEPQTTSDMNGSAYFSWGFRYDGRLGPSSSIDTTAELTSVMDARTSAACEYAKKERGIQIYTIGLNASTTNKVLLTKCASSASHAYFPTNPNQLNSVFRSIAEQLSPLRLSQ